MSLISTSAGLPTALHSPMRMRNLIGVICAYAIYEGCGPYARELPPDDFSRIAPDIISLAGYACMHAGLEVMDVRGLDVVVLTNRRICSHCTVSQVFTYCSVHYYSYK